MEQFHFELLHKEINLTKSKLRTLLKTNFLNTDFLLITYCF